MRSFLRWFWSAAVLTATILWPAIAWAQTPLPGQQVEENRPWTWYMSILIGVGAVGLFLLILFSYFRLSGRFYGKEEPPVQAQRPRYAAISAPTVTSPSAPASQLAAGPAQPPVQPAAQPAAQPPTDQAGNAPAAQPAGEASEPAQAQEPAPAPAPAPAAAPAKPAEVEPDQETFDRVLKEQLDAGTDRRVAEGRAKAAAIKAAREKSG